jgi:hypothetical protein
MIFFSSYWLQGTNRGIGGYNMNGRFQMQGGKNWIFPKEMNANRFFWDSHWLEIWSNHFCPSMGYRTEWRERGYGLSGRFVIY